MLATLWDSGFFGCILKDIFFSDPCCFGLNKHRKRDPTESVGRRGCRRQETHQRLQVDERPERKQ